ncbi:succinate-semialdehyde dehydrogenase [Pseudomonas aeruginosa]|nr:succinate-semialdehyde dehydrogenase [Pseudomonas aeruginosa]
MSSWVTAHNPRKLILVIKTIRKETNVTTFNVISPIDGQKLLVGNTSSDAEVAAALNAAETAFKTWKLSSKLERAQLVEALADELLKRADDLSRAVSLSIGRPAAQANEAQRFKAVTLAQIEALEELGDERYPSDTQVTRFVRRSGQGVHLSIAPWNYPVGLLPWLIVTPILGGNTVILKHAAQTTLIGRIVKEAYEAIGGPAGVLQVLELGHDQVTSAIKSGSVKGVNFIGSVGGGLAVHAAAAGTLTHVHLELGGKDPAYVRPDADIATAAAEIADGCFSNAGQSCCSVERIYLHEAIRDPFLECFRNEMLKYKLGHPMDPATTVGPVVKASAAEFIRNQIRGAIAMGAQAYVEPALEFSVENASCYLAPTLLTGVTADMHIMQEETFGPVACVQTVRDDAEAIRLMNDSKFGLTASVWTSDLDAGLGLVDQLDAGTVFVNRCDHADLYLPWGGQKLSGLGRGNGKEGLLGVMDVKSFHLRAL